MKSIFIATILLVGQILMILQGSSFNFLNLLHRTVFWDAKYYACIGESGYSFVYPSLITTCTLNNVVFWPFFPIVGKVLGWIFHTPVQNALVGAGLACAFGFWLLFLRLLKRADFPPLLQTAIVLFFFAFPTTFFMVLPYTEGLYLFLSVLMATFFFSASESVFVYLGLFLTGVALSLTRVQGATMGISFGVLFLLRWSDREIRSRSFVAGSGVLTGAVSFFLYVKTKFGGWNIVFYIEKLGFKLVPNYKKPFLFLKTYKNLSPLKLYLHKDIFDHDLFLGYFTFVLLMIPMVIMIFRRKSNRDLFWFFIPFAVCSFYLSLAGTSGLGYRSLARYCVPVVLFAVIAIADQLRTKRWVTALTFLLSVMALLFMFYQVKFAGRFAVGEWVG